MFFKKNNQKASEIKKNEQKITEVGKNDLKITEVKRKRQDSEEEEIEQPSCSSKTAEPTPTIKKESVSVTPYQNDIVVSSDRESTGAEKPAIPEFDKIECNRIIEKLFLVNMPDDFFDFWKFCKSLSPKNPQGMMTRFTAQNFFFFFIFS